MLSTCNKPKQGRTTSSVVSSTFGVRRRSTPQVHRALPKSSKIHVDQTSQEIKQETIIDESEHTEYEPYGYSVLLMPPHPHSSLSVSGSASSTTALSPPSPAVSTSRLGLRLLGGPAPIVWSSSFLCCFREIACAGSCVGGMWFGLATVGREEGRGMKRIGSGAVTDGMGEEGSDDEH
jgi:hypothetical protein